MRKIALPAKQGVWTVKSTLRIIVWRLIIKEVAGSTPVQGLMVFPAYPFFYNFLPVQNNYQLREQGKDVMHEIMFRVDDITIQPR